MNDSAVCNRDTYARGMDIVTAKKRLHHYVAQLNEDMSDITPTQHTGKAVDALTTKDLITEENAKIFYTIVREKLRSVNHWSEIAGVSSFQLTDIDGHDINDRAPIKNDHIKINIPGLPNAEGGGFDWVRVEEIETSGNDDMEEYGFRVRPAHNPIKNNGETAHFYSSDATSSFVVRRAGSVVSAEVHDRNTKTNEESTGVIDTLRNTVTGLAGLIGFSKIQWQILTDGLLAE